MLLEMFQKVRLASGETAHIVEVFNNGEAYMVDVMIDKGDLDAAPPIYPEYETKTICPNEISSIIVEIEEPFVTAR
ncbi:MAG: hypothetical protein FWB71_05960 [Defluviitaleaceae bacterium]|nr:hypothetical protein [Defluviitaleaceae bacterium]